MGGAASTGMVNNGLTKTNPDYATGVLLKSTSCQTDESSFSVAAVQPTVRNDVHKVVKANVPVSSSANAEASVEQVWLQVNETLDVPSGKKFNEKDLVKKRTGWGTVRIFVSSTFKDLNNEREVLVKEVFPDLREWCEARRLHLVDCDLRWGIPKDSTSEMTIRMCLGEIDRCYQDNTMPFFLNMTSERIGWIPLPDEVPKSLVDEYRWIFGLSVTEMEIVHGAYRKDNPNSLFMIRDESFINTVPEEYRSEFLDKNDVLAPSKLALLKQMVSSRFPSDRVIKYTCEYDGVSKGQSKLKIDPEFTNQIFEFFKRRIEMQYPYDNQEVDPFLVVKESHEAFLQNKAACVLGRTEILQKIRDTVDGKNTDVPLLVLGNPGTGKSSIMAKIAEESFHRASKKEIPGDGGRGWHVFYHFVGAVPGSTEVLALIQRLLYELGADRSSLTSDLENAVQVCASTLNNQSTKPVIIFIDALNQLDNEKEAMLMNWIPRKLCPHVRVICSMIEDTPQHKALRERESKPLEVLVQPLTLTTRKDIVADMLGKFNKKLDMDQMFNLLTKESSANPLWLSVACEELRVFGSFREISDKINSMADGLLELLDQVLQRFEQEGGGHLLVATLCLLEVSTRGLLENELLQILADEDHLMPPVYDKNTEKGEKEKSEQEGKWKSYGQLPAFKWATVYRLLRPFLRPFGNSGEGRLDFYHRSLSKAVRRKYLKMAGDEPGVMNEKYRWWHRKLADYFEQSTNHDRRTEEYPHHLIQLKDVQRMEEFLDNWDTFDRLFESEHSPRLLKYWQMCGGNQKVMECYSAKLQQMKEDPLVSKEALAQRYIDVARFLVQVGEYDQSLEIAGEAQKLYEAQESTTDQQMANLEKLLTLIWDQKTKLHEFCSQSQVPEIKEMLSHCNQAIEYLSKLAEGGATDMKREMGMQLVKKAFGLANLVDCGGDSCMTKEETLALGNKAIDDAIAIFDSIQDLGHKAEAVMTRAVLCRYDFNFQVKNYNEAVEMCRQAYGDLHILTGRIYMNTGIVYEDNGNYEKSYEYFRKNYDVLMQVFGPHHIRTRRAIGVLNETTYRRIASQRGETIPELPEA